MDGFIQSKEIQATELSEEIPIGLVMVIFEDLQDHIINKQRVEESCSRVHFPRPFYRSENL